MKPRILLTALIAAVFFSGTANAQLPGVKKVSEALPKVDLGLKLGANFNQLAGTSFKKAYQPGIVAGAFFGVRKGKFGGRIEGLVSSAKYTYTLTATTNGTYKNLYLDIPLMFEYKLLNRLWAQAGPQYSKVLNSSTDLPLSAGTVAKDYFKPSFSGVLGLEARLPAHMRVGARYILGLTDIKNASVTAASGAWHTRTIQAYVGYNFL